MIYFPHCKINLGLDVLAKRPDGYHDIDTVMFPVYGLCDSLEIVPSAEEPSFSFSGMEVNCSGSENLIVKTWRLLHENLGTPSVKAHLHKVIPFGAGLGGGSSDAAFMLRGLGELFSPHPEGELLHRAAAALGSDVPFFMQDSPMHCTGRGERMSPISLPLSGYWITLVKPAIFVSTAEAYAGITPSQPDVPLRERLLRPVPEWKECVTNAFEKSVFAAHPRLAEIKTELYDAGAVYASMSGSGSALYGLFRERPIRDSYAGSDVWTFRL